MIHKHALFIAGSIGLCAILLASVLMGNSYMERIDAMSPGPYVVERHDGQQLFVGADSLGWTASLPDAQRFGTFAQARSVQSRIGGMVMSIREVVR
jgi:hypothetical protein